MNETQRGRFPEDYIVVDVGMHDGKDSEYYLKRGFRVIAFEANPDLCKQAIRKFENLRLLERIDIRNSAISDEPGQEAVFFVNSFNSAWSSLDSSLGKRRAGAREITVTTCDLFDELFPVCERIHMVKIDIEGFDVVALRQIARLPHAPNYISVENGSSEMIGILHEIGYRGFKFSNQREVPNQQVPQNQKHGAVVAHVFDKGASGVFGEDLLGRWMEKEEAISICDALSSARRLAPRNLFAEAVGWFDLHARLGESDFRAEGQ